MAGVFFSFEGIDFSGKSTQIKKLTHRLEQRQLPVLFVREPGGTAISEEIRAILLDHRNIDMHARTEILLYAAARAQIVEEKIRPALAQGQIVLCDRYIDSTAAYQGCGRHLGLETTTTINRFATQALLPARTFLLDISPETAEQRRQLAGKSQDRLEQEAREFHARVRAGYLQIATAEPDRFVVIDGEQPMPEIAEQIWQGAVYVLQKHGFTDLGE